MTDGKTRVCGVMANPVEHSLSPMMHNFYAGETGVNFVYIPCRVEQGLTGDAVRGAYALNLAGLNVTVPYKQEVMKYLKEIDEDAAAIGAVNTLVRIEGGYKGYNTDAAGLSRALAEEKIAVAGELCVLIGAGGAARAAAYVLAREGAKTVYLLNRSRERAEALAETVNRTAGRRVILPMALADYRELPEGPYVAIQSTSVGMHPNVDQAPIEDPEFYRKIHTGLDVIYTPAETKFMRYVTAAGGRACNGLDMLIYQGIAAYELWNPEVTCSAETIQAAREMLTKHLEGQGHEG